MKKKTIKKNLIMNEKYTYVYVHIYYYKINIEIK